MNKKLIRLTESDLHKIVSETVSRMLKEDYNGRYDELVKDEMHRMAELERQVPEWLKPEIHGMVVTLESILSNIKTSRNIERI